MPTINTNGTSVEPYAWEDLGVIYPSSNDYQMPLNTYSPSPTTTRDIRTYEELTPARHTDIYTPSDYPRTWVRTTTNPYLAELPYQQLNEAERSRVIADMFEALDPVAPTAEYITIPEDEHKPEGVLALALSIFNTPKAQQDIVLSCLKKYEYCLYKLVKIQLAILVEEQHTQDNNRERKLDLDL